MAQKVPFSHRLDVVIDSFRSLFEMKFKKKRTHPANQPNLNSNDVSVSRCVLSLSCQTRRARGNCHSIGFELETDDDERLKFA